MSLRIWIAALVAVVVALVLWSRCAPGGTGGHGAASSASRATIGKLAGAARVEPRGGAPAAIAGAVRDEHRAPIAAARVCAIATSWRLPSALAYELEPVCGVTDRDGAFVLAGLVPTTYTVTAMAPGFALEPYWPDGEGHDRHEGDGSLGFAVAPGEVRGGVELVMHAGHEVSGTIRDAGGGSIAAASIVISSSIPHHGDVSVVVASDAYGHYAAWTRASSVGLGVSADGYVPSTRFGEAPSVMDIVLQPAATLAGTVIDARGEPVAGATVEVQGTDPDRAAPGETALSDDAGRFTLKHLPPGRFLVHGRAAHGLGQAEASTLLGLGQHVDGVVVRLAAAHQIVGQVFVESTGAPCDSAAVTLLDDAHGLSANVVRDPDVGFRADGVLPGSYVPSVSCDDHVEHAHYPPVVVVDRDVTARWEVSDGAAITGRVHDANGVAVANVRVLAQGVPTTPRSQASFGVADTMADGSYVIRGLAPGRYKLSGSRPDPFMQGSDRRSTEVEVELTGHATVARDLVLPVLGGTIVGHVTATDGRAVAACRVGVRSDKDQSSMGMCDDAGRFSLQDLTPGSYRVVASIDDRRGPARSVPETGVEVVVTAGQVVEANLVLELPSGTIRGIVVDDRGQPVSDAFVGVTHESDEAPAIRSARSDDHELMVGSDGRFVATELGDGRFTLVAHRQGGGEVILAHVSPGSEVTLTLGPTASVAGTIRRPGAPVEQFDVTLFDRDTSQRVRGESFAGGGAAAARYALRDVPPGHYQVMFSAHGAHQMVPLDLEPGQQASLDVELAGTVTLVGRAIDIHTQRPIAGAMMVAQLVGIDTTFSMPSDLRDVSDADGRFEIPNVPRGAISIWGTSHNVVDGDLSPIPTDRTVPARGPDIVDLGTIAVVATRTGATSGDAGFEMALAGDPPLLHVTAITPGGAAERAGLVVGDALTAVGGFDVTGPDRAYVSRLLSGDVGAAVSITLARGATLTIVLAAPAP